MLWHTSPPWRGEFRKIICYKKPGWVNMKRNIIPYNPKLKEMAKQLRQNMTFSEVKLWNELKNGQLMEYDFDRQRPVGNYIVDFFCKDLQLAIEVDGITHLDEKVIVKDFVRQEEIESYGVNFLRFDALLVVNKVEAAVREIRNWIIEYEEKNGVNEFVLGKRKLLENPVSRKRK
jgi:very-short-patch-repair endonuclease